MGRPPGKIKTFPRVVELLTAAVKEKGQKTIEAETKLSQSMISRYLKGEGEPSQATLEKLAAYFGVTVAWLRGGESPLDLLENVTADEMMYFAIKSAFPGGEQAVVEGLIERGFEEETVKYFLERTKGLFPPELIAKNYKVAIEDEIIKPIIDGIYSGLVLQKDIDKDWLQEAMQQAGKTIIDERVKPLIETIFNLSTQDVVSISAIIDSYTKNEKFKNDVKLLLNNPIAHSK